MIINFKQIWEKVVKPLEGTTVYTLKDREPNKIIEVSDSFLIRDSENDSPPQTIPIEVFETVYNFIMDKGEISRVEINKALPKRFSSILCAVLARAPNIGYDLNPIRIYKK